jgi:hypothetical protein
MRNDSIILPCICCHLPAKPRRPHRRAHRDPAAGAAAGQGTQPGRAGRALGCQQGDDLEGRAGAEQPHRRAAGPAGRRARRAAGAAADRGKGAPAAAAHAAAQEVWRDPEAGYLRRQVAERGRRAAGWNWSRSSCRARRRSAIRDGAASPTANACGCSKARCGWTTATSASSSRPATAWTSAWTGPGLQGAGAGGLPLPAGGQSAE